MSAFVTAGGEAVTFMKDLRTLRLAIFIVFTSREREGDDRKLAMTDGKLLGNVKRNYNGIKRKRGKKNVLLVYKGRKNDDCW